MYLTIACGYPMLIIISFEHIVLCFRDVVFMSYQVQGCSARVEVNSSGVPHPKSVNGIQLQLELSHLVRIDSLLCFTRRRVRSVTWYEFGKRAFALSGKGLLLVLRLCSVWFRTRLKSSSKSLRSTTSTLRLRSRTSTQGCSKRSRRLRWRFVRPWVNCVYFQFFFEFFSSIF